MVDKMTEAEKEEYGERLEARGRAIREDVQRFADARQQQQSTGQWPEDVNTDGSRKS